MSINNCHVHFGSICIVILKKENQPVHLILHCVPYNHNAMVFIVQTKKRELSLMHKMSLRFLAAADSGRIERLIMKSLLNVYPLQ